MLTCDLCGQDVKTGAGLASHRRWRHADDLVEGGTNAGPNLLAVRRTIKELERLGRFEQVDAARRQSLVSIARALDENPFNSQMWREYRESLNEVLRADDDADDDLAAALAQIGSGPALGNTTTS